MQITSGTCIPIDFNKIVTCVHMLMWDLCEHARPPQGFEKTGLGQRIANLFVKAMGKSTLGLALGLNIAETLLAPAMPSTSARAGGIFMPIIKSLSEASGSFPGEAERQ